MQVMASGFFKSLFLFFFAFESDDIVVYRLRMNMFAYVRLLVNKRTGLFFSLLFLFLSIGKRGAFFRLVGFFIYPLFLFGNVLFILFFVVICQIASPDMSVVTRIISYISSAVNYLTLNRCFYDKNVRKFIFSLQTDGKTKVPP